MDMRQNPSGPGPKPDAKDDDVMDQDHDPMEGKEDKMSGLDLGALERDLLEYQFSDDDDGDDAIFIYVPYEGGNSQLVTSRTSRPGI